MLTDRQSRISLLARTNYSRRSAGQFLSELSPILGRQLTQDSLLPIDASDSFRDGSLHAYQHGMSTGENFYRTQQPTQDFDRVESKVAKLCQRIGAEPAILLPPHFQPCVRITVSEVLQRTKSVLEFDRDTLLLSSVDGRCGFMLDWNPDDVEWTYELAIWGAKWVGERL